MVGTSDIVVGLFAIGMGLSFLGADPKSPTSRALALCLSFLGLGMLLNVPLTSGIVEFDRRT